jgi:hypothetical protein
VLKGLGKICETKGIQHLRSHPSHTQQTPPAAASKGQSLHRPFSHLAVDGCQVPQMGRGTNPPLRALIKGGSSSCPQRMQCSGELFQMLGAFHQASAVPFGSKINEHLPITAQGRTIHTRCSVQPWLYKDNSVCWTQTQMESYPSREANPTSAMGNDTPPFSNH